MERSPDGKFTIEHGGAYSREYQIWANMIDRCHGPNPRKYYGAQGVTVCRRWRNSFSAFIADMGKRPSIRHSIERKRNSGNYTPGNCRWALPFDQAQNRRSTTRLRIGSERLTLREISVRYGLPFRTLQQRSRRGWPTDRLISQPKRSYPREASEW